MQLPADPEIIQFVHAALNQVTNRVKFEIKHEIYYDELFDYLTDLVKSGEVRSVQALTLKGINYVYHRVKKLNYTNDELEVGYNPITRFTSVEYDRYLCDLNASEQVILNTLIHVDYSEFSGLLQLLKDAGRDYTTPLLKRAIDIRMTKMADSIEVSSDEDTITRKLLILGRLESFDPNLAKLYAIAGPEWMLYFTLVFGGEAVQIPTQKEFIGMLGEVDEFRKSPEVVLKYGKWKSLVKLSDKTSFSGALLCEYLDHTVGLITRLASESGAYDKMHHLFREFTQTFMKITHSIKELSDFERRVKGMKQHGKHT